MSDQPKEKSNAVGNVHFTECSSGGDPEAMAKMMRSMHGPQAVDHSLRQAKIPVYRAIDNEWQIPYAHE